MMGAAAAVLLGTPPPHQAWGEPDDAGGFRVQQAADGTVSTTPSRRVKMAVATRGASPNPLHSSARGGGGGGDGDGGGDAESATAPALPSGVPAANPFK